MIEFAQYLAIARRWWWLLVVSALLGACIGLTMSMRAPPVYRASASLLVRSGGSTEDYSSVMASEKMALTYENLLTKRPVIEQAARILDLSPEQIADRLDVQLVSKTLVIELSVHDGDPRRAAEIANAVVMAFVKTQQESGNARARDIMIVEYATPPSTPVSPNMTRTITIAAAGGLVLGASLAFLIELSNDKLEGVADIRQKLSIPTLAVIPRHTKTRVASSRKQRRRKRARSRAGHQGDPLPPTLLASPYSLASPNGDRSLADKSQPVVSSHRTPNEISGASVGPGPGIDESPVDKRAVEAYLTLRTWIQFSYRDGPLPSLVITSPRSRREKTEVAINLGIALAQAGLRVVLIDADLREPSLHQRFNDAPNEGMAAPSLSELLSRGGNWQKHTIETGVPNLSLLPAGSPSPDPLRLASSPEMVRLLRKLEKQADVILINAPPVLAAADALVLAAQVDGTLLILEDHGTRFRWAIQALKMLYNAQANVLGAVLTRARLQASDLPPHYDFGRPAASQPPYRAIQTIQHNAGTSSNGALSDSAQIHPVRTLATDRAATTPLALLPTGSATTSDGGNGHVN